MSFGWCARIPGSEYAIAFLKLLLLIIARAGSVTARHGGQLCWPNWSVVQNSVASRLALIPELQYESNKTSSGGDSGSEKPAT